MKLFINKHAQLKLGLIILLLFFQLIIISLIELEFSIQINLNYRLEPISPKFPLGTDDLGRDLISSVLYGVFCSLFIGISVVMSSVFIGATLGLLAGLMGGFIDSLIMRIVDIILSFPGILIAITFFIFVKANFFSITCILTFSNWVFYARIVRGETLKYKKMDFVISAKVYNASFFRIVFFHLFPIISPLIVIQAFLGIGEVILIESSLNFLGIGLGPEIPTLGQLIGAGRFHLFDRPHLALVPGAVLFVLILAFNFIGEGIGSLFRNSEK
jgi:peptide/nickel transport system permease protein